MTALRNLVKYKQMVESIDFDTVRRDINSRLSAVSNDIDLHQFDAHNLKDSMLQQHLKVLNILEDWSLDLNTFREEIGKLATSLEEPYYEKSHTIHQRHLELSPHDKLQKFRNCNLLHNDETKELLIGHVRNATNDQYSAMIINGGQGDITSNLLHGTPLYVVDEDEFILNTQKKMFNTEMQKRVRFYLINNQDSLKTLPQNMFSCIVAVDWFNFKTVDVIKTHLVSMYKTLRPGGKAIFTFNNCDYPKAIDKVDEMYYTYTTSREMQNLVTDIGYKISKAENRGYDELDNGISWLEIQKPGKLHTIRAVQGLASIEQL